MRKILLGIACGFIVFLNASSVSASSGCLDYGFGAYEDFTGYCKCMSGYVWGTFLGKPYCVSGSTYCYDNYGYGSEYDYLGKACKCSLGYVWDTSYSGETCVSCSTKYGYGSTSDTGGGCKCRSGYVWSKNLLGDPNCVSGDTYCSDLYGYGAEYDSFAEGCKCRSGYAWSDSYSSKKCVSASDICRDKIGSNSQYNSLSDKCECNSGYELTQKILSGLECKSCSNKYGYHSSYNYLSKKCECDSGYTLDDDNQCVEKQNNVYFKLIELDSNNNTALIKSEYDNKYYSVEYRSGCYSSSFNRYLNKQIVINLGTDFSVDKGDKIVLQDDKETCEISSFERVDSSFTIFPKEKENTIIVPQIKKPEVTYDKKVSNALKGKILLQVESHGEAWYVNPKDGLKYYMANGDEAYNVMRNFGVGITNKDLEKIKIDKILAKKNSGKIFLQVEAKGEAYYIDFNGVAHYLKDGAAAYEIMRSLGLGVTNNDLNKIIEGNL